MFVFPSCLTPGTKGQSRKMLVAFGRAVCLCFYLCVYVRLCVLSPCAYSLRLIVLSVFSSSLSACPKLAFPDPPDHNLSLSVFHFSSFTSIYHQTIVIFTFLSLSVHSFSFPHHSVCLSYFLCLY